MASNSAQLRFDGRVAIVTGAAQGIGRAHAIVLGSRGAKVVVNDLDAAGAAKTVKEIQAAGGEAVAATGSIADRAVAQAAVDAAINNWGRIDILINNAGIDICKPFAEYTDADFERVMGVHVWGAWRLTQLAWPHMKKAKYGRVLMTSSQSIFGMPGNSAYTTAKGAVFSMGRTLALEGKEDGILVNLIAPVAGTAMAKSVVGGGSVHEWMERTYPPTNVAEVAAWLVHEDCKSSCEFVANWATEVGSIWLSHTRGVKCEEVEGKLTAEAVRDNYAKVMDYSKTLPLKSMMDIHTQIMAPDQKVDF